MRFLEKKAAGMGLQVKVKIEAFPEIYSKGEFARLHVTLRKNEKWWDGEESSQRPGPSMENRRHSKTSAEHDIKNK